MNEPKPTITMPAAATPGPTPTTLFEYVVTRQIKTDEGIFSDFTFAYDARDPKTVVEAFVTARSASINAKTTQTSYFKLDSGCWPFSQLVSISQVSPVEASIQAERDSKVALRLAMAQAIRDGEVDPLDVNMDGEIREEGDEEEDEDEPEDGDEPAPAATGFGGLSAGR